MAYDDDDIVTPSKCHDKPDNGTIHAEPDHDAIKPLAHELVFPGDTEVDWAEDLDEEMGFNLQDEYIQATYPPTPAPTPWHPTPPPTSKYTHSQTHYNPS